MALSDPGPKRSASANILDALRLSRQASPGLFALVVVVLPALEGLFAIGLLLLFKGGVTAFLGEDDAPRQTIEEFLPYLAAAVIATSATLLLTNTRFMLQELLLDRVRQFSARRMHDAIASLELVDFDDPKVHDRISRAEATADFKPRLVVRGVNAFLVSAFQIIAFTAVLIALEPLLLPMMLAAAAPILAISSKLAGDQFSFFYKVTPLERQRRYVGSLITGRRSAAEARSFRLSPHFAARYDEITTQRYDELRRMVRTQWRRLLAGQVTRSGPHRCGRHPGLALRRRPDGHADPPHCGGRDEPAGVRRRWAGRAHSRAVGGRAVPRVTSRRSTTRSATPPTRGRASRSPVR